MVSIIITVSILSALFLGAAWMSRLQIERLLFFIGTFLVGNDTQSKVALITPVSKYTFMNANGDLVSYVLIRGARRLIGVQEFNSLSSAINSELSSKMREGTGKQHEFSFSYLSDPNGAGELINYLLAPSIATANRMGASVHSSVWFDEKANLLKTLCNDEVMLMSITTLRSGCLTDRDSARYTQWLKEVRGKVHQSLKEQNITLAEITGSEFVQPILPVYSIVNSRHEATVNSIVERFAKLSSGGNSETNETNSATNYSSDSMMGLISEKLDVERAIYYVKRFVNGHGVPINWRPRVLDSVNPAATNIRVKGDLAHILPIPLARQIFTEAFREHFESVEYVESEGIHYASLKMDVFATKTPSPSFSNLVNSLGKSFPYTYSVEILSNGLGQRQMDHFFAGFFGGFGQHNKMIKGAWDELKERNANGEYIAAQRAVFTTWAKSLNELVDNMSFMKMCVQSWGGATVSNESGSPLGLLVSSAPSLSRNNPAPIMPAPMSAISRQIPLYRTASPWTDGQLLLRTEDGLPYPVMFGSTKQAAWGTLVFAPPGRGKSFLMNTLNAGLFFSAGIRDLPYITIVDKGMSSANVIEMAKGMLPENRRHQAISIRLRNTVEYAINIFDTQLGLDIPTERERSSQVNIMSAICPSLGDNAMAFIGQVIDEAYKALGRNSLKAKRWQRALDRAITERIEAEGMDLSNDNNMPRIWQVVDFLFDLGEVSLATRAQRFAVPIMDDLIASANSTVVKDLYHKTPTPSHELIIDVFMRSVTTALREYALLSTYTRFDIGDARVIAIDLEEVLASSSSEDGRRRAAIMMMFARQLGAKNYFLKWEDEFELLVPDRYRVYQEARTKVMFETLKFLEYDEFHNAQGMSDVLREVKQDFREGRKYNVVPLLSSQLFSDFDDDLVETANNFFVLGVGSAGAAGQLQKAFHLTDAERMTILNKCLGPSSLGAPMFGLFKTNDGMVSELLFNSASIMEQWAFNSSALDTSMRREVTRAVGGDYWLALKGLAHFFPKGTARYDIEQLRHEMAELEGADDDGVVATFARKIGIKIKQKYLS